MSGLGSQAHLVFQGWGMRQRKTLGVLSTYFDV